MNISTEDLRNYSNYVLIFGLVCAAFGTFGVNHFRAKLEKEREHSARQKEVAESSRQDKRDTQLSELVALNQDLNAKLGPFEKLARQLFPSLPPDEAMKRLESRLGGVESRTAAIEEKAKPRAVDSKGVSAFNLALKPCAGQIVGIEAIGGDPEAMALARDLFDRFRAAGLSVPALPGTIISPDSWAGILVEIPPGSPKETGSAIERALAAVGLRASVSVGSSDTIRVRVGHKQ